MPATIDLHMGVSYNIEEVFHDEVQHISTSDSEQRTFLDWLTFCKGEGAIKWHKIKKQQSLIDKFIKSEPKIQPVKGVLTDSPEFDVEHQSPKKAYADMIVSETLANIYYQQKKFALSIETYRKLCLLYPEKSAYFASQIKKIEKELES